MPGSRIVGRLGVPAVAAAAAAREDMVAAEGERHERGLAVELHSLGRR